MKHYLHFTSMLTALIMTGCSADDVIDSITTADIDCQPISQSKNRSMAEAAQIAIEAIPMIEDAGARSTRTLNMNSAKVFTSQLARSSANVDTLMYVFNFDNDAGFAVVAANRATEALIAITEKGSYDPDETPDNPGLALYMAAAKEYLSGISTLSQTDSLKDIGGPPVSIIPDDPRAQYKVVRDTLTNEYVKERIKLKWGQGGASGIFCPNQCAGCVPLAAAMTICYLGYPYILSITYDGNGISRTFDYDKMMQHLNPICGDDAGQHEQIGHLCREIGHRANSKYEYYYDSRLERYKTETVTTYANIRSTLLGFGLNVTPATSYSFSNLRRLLNDNTIVLMGGHSADQSVGHMWIVDGYKYIYVKYGEYTKPSGSISWKLLNQWYTTTRMAHINWGWEGKGNGFFWGDVFEPSKVVIPDYTDQPSSSDITDNYSQDLIIFSVSKF